MRLAVEPPGLNTMVEGDEIIGGSSGGVGGRGASGAGARLSEALPRDSAKGKGVVEEATEVSIERAEFQPAVGSSRHQPVSKGDFVELVDDAMLARLLQDNPTVVAVVVATQEERQRAIALAQEEELLWDQAEKAWAKGEDMVRETEASSGGGEVASGAGGDGGCGLDTCTLFSDSVCASYATPVRSFGFLGLQTTAAGL